MPQVDLFGNKKELWYCIHCNYYGYKFIKDGEFELCPKCHWVVYSDSEVEESFLHTNVYPKLKKKYFKVHRIDVNENEFEFKKRESSRLDNY